MRAPSFLFLIVGLILGLWAGRTWWPRDAENPAVCVGCASLEGAREDLRLISETDYREYLSLKDVNARNKKADEMLEKIMLLFLADLGFKAPPRATEAPVAAAEPTPSQPPVAQPTPATASSPQEPAKPAAVAAPSWKGRGLIVRNAHSDFGVQEALKEARITDLFSELKTASPLNRESLRAVNGDFAGEITFKDRKTPPWQVEWSVDGFTRNRKVEGRYEIRLSKNGKVFSRTTGSRGSLKAFMSFAGDDTAILVNAYGDDGFMQLYPTPRGDQLVGNFYLKKGMAGEFTYEGAVNLQKVR